MKKEKKTKEQNIEGMAKMQQRIAELEKAASARQRVETERENLILELKKALSEIKTLSGLLPICAHCKKIRNDEGYWEQIEGYIKERSLAEFSHGICPECMNKYYPDRHK
jgi:hypothetical protein